MNLLEECIDCGKKIMKFTTRCDTCLKLYIDQKIDESRKKKNG